MGYKIDSNHRVMITGGGGYLGSRLAKKLLEYNCEIYLVDIRFNNLSTSLEKEHSNVCCQGLDLKDKERVIAYCNKIKPDFIFHFASLVDRSRDFFIYDNLHEVNVKGTLNLLEGLKKIGYLGFYFSSTSEVYGAWEGTPFKEDQQLHPMSPYSLTKVHCENILRVFSEIYSKPYKIFRIFNFCGPDLPDNTFIGQMLRSYHKGIAFEMTKGEQARDMLFIDDLLNQICLVLESDVEYSIFNICSGKSIKMIDIAKEFKVVTHGVFKYATSLSYRMNEVWETRGDNNRIKSLGFDSSDPRIYSWLEKCIGSKN